MKSNLYKLLEFINDYTKENGECPTFYEISVGINVNRDKVEELLHSAHKVGMLLPIQVRNRKRKERNWRLSEHGLEYLELIKINA